MERKLVGEYPPDVKSSSKSENFPLQEEGEMFLPEFDNPDEGVNPITLFGSIDDEKKAMELLKLLNMAGVN